jgi:hypothetical protein
MQYLWDGSAWHLRYGTQGATTEVDSSAGWDSIIDADGWLVLDLPYGEWDYINLRFTDGEEHPTLAYANSRESAEDYWSAAWMTGSPAVLPQDWHELQLDVDLYRSGAVDIVLTFDGEAVFSFPVCFCIGEHKHAGVVKSADATLMYSPFEGIEVLP